MAWPRASALQPVKAQTTTSSTGVSTIERRWTAGRHKPISHKKKRKQQQQDEPLRRPYGDVCPTWTTSCTAMDWPRVEVCPSAAARPWQRCGSCADPTGALPPVEIDLPGGGAIAAEAGGLGFEPRPLIPCKIGYNVWIYCLSHLRWLYRSTWLGGQVVSPSPRDKEDYPGITINPKLTIFGVA